MEQSTVEQIIANNVGLERPIDRLGRVSIPIEFRRALNLDMAHDRVVISKVGDYLLLWNAKGSPQCVICGSREDLVTNAKKTAHICQHCLAELNEEQ